LARCGLLVLAVGGLVLTVAGLIGVLPAPKQDPVYSVAAVRAQLARDPHVWTGRAVRVQGLTVSPDCIERESVLCARRSPYTANIVDPVEGSFLPLTQVAATPLLAVLRRLPLARDLVPAAPTLYWGTRATYWVRLRAAPAGSCALAPCYEAVLLDVAPVSR
jgi:hypothetical protein